MPWWLALVLGLLAGGLIGYVVGRIVPRSSETTAAAGAKIEAIDAAADAERNKLDSHLKKVLDETPGLVGKDLEDAINADFDSRPALPPANPALRRPDDK